MLFRSIDPPHRLLARLLFGHMGDQPRRAGDHEDAVEYPRVKSQVGEHGPDGAVNVDRQRLADAGMVRVDDRSGHAGWAYLRFRELRYDDAELEQIATRLRSVTNETFAYFRHGDEPDADFQLVQDQAVLNVLSTVRPPDVRVTATVPSFAWTAAGTGTGGTGTGNRTATNGAPAAPTGAGQ